MSRFLRTSPAIFPSGPSSSGRFLPYPLLSTKLEAIFTHNEITSVTVVKIEKPCCSDLVDFVFRAAKMSHLPVPIQVTNLFVDAEDVIE